MPYVYIIKNVDNKVYIGVSQKPQQRLDYHNKNRGALFTKNRKSFQIVLLEKYETLTEARKRENQIKNWRRDKKEKLIERYQKGLPTTKKLFK